jgi:hypothetical protein
MNTMRTLPQSSSDNVDYGCTYRIRFHCLDERVRVSLTNRVDEMAMSTIESRRCNPMNPLISPCIDAISADFPTHLH